MICAPKKFGNNQNLNIDKNYEKKIYFFADHNYWATKMYIKSKFVLDLPWLDTIIPKLEEKFDPQFALRLEYFQIKFSWIKFNYIMIVK